jgi:hypothetical protein
MENNDALLVTIVGWFVTALLQAFLIIRQNRLERNLAAYQLYTPRRIKQLDEFMEWIHEGMQLMMECETEHFKRKIRLDLPLKDEAKVEYLPFRQLRRKHKSWEEKNHYFHVAIYKGWLKDLGMEAYRQTGIMAGGLHKLIQGRFSSTSGNMARWQRQKLEPYDINPTDIYKAYHYLVETTDAYIRKIAYQ